MANGTDQPNTSWMSDVQRALALIIIGALAFTAIIIVIRLVVWGDAATLVDIGKTLLSNLQNMALIALGFFFGSNMSKQLADAGQQKIVEKLTGSAPPPTAPAAGPPWWGQLTDSEKQAMDAAALSDPEIAKFVAAAKLGRATPEQLVYVLSKGLLSEARAKEIGG